MLAYSDYKTLVDYSISIRVLFFSKFCIFIPKASRTPAKYKTLMSYIAKRTIASMLIGFRRLACFSFLALLRQPAGLTVEALSSPPGHVAIIPDGNGRWAEARGLPRAAGHAAGARRVGEIISACRRSFLSYCTIPAFLWEGGERD